MKKDIIKRRSRRLATVRFKHLANTGEQTKHLIYPHTFGGKCLNKWDEADNQLEWQRYAERLFQEKTSEFQYYSVERDIHKNMLVWISGGSLYNGHWHIRKSE